MRARRAVLRRSRPRRAVELLEFTMLLPITVFFLVFIINMGLLVVTDGLLHDAAFNAAQVGAQNGQIDPYGALSTASQTMTDLGAGYSTGNLTVNEADVVTQAGYGGSPVCTSGSGGYTIVKVTLTYQVPMLPGMGTLLNMISHSGGSLGIGSSYPIHATGVAQCEIARQ